jgi:hypothetical protein
VAIQIGVPELANSFFAPFAYFAVKKFFSFAYKAKATGTKPVAF